jgi:hypothetical protein
MSSIDVIVNQINTTTTVIIVAVSLVKFVLGAIGLIFNVLVFTRPSLYRQPCSLYFFSSTCFNLFVVFVVIPVRIVSEGFNMDLANYNLGICKTEIFAFNVVRTISCWLIVLACVDRYFHSSASASVRRISSLKTARLGIGITSVAITILYSHMIVYYEIYNMYNQFGNIVPQCYGQKGIYRTFKSFWYMALYSICPSLLMFLFGFLTLIHLRQQRQAAQRIPETNQTVRRTDNQLLRMLITQVLVITIATLPFTIYQLYASFTTSLAKDTLRLALENLAGEAAGVLTYFAHSSSFYLYTLTGTVFRKELLKIIGRYWHPNRNQVHIAHGEPYQMLVLQNNQRITATHNAPIRK